MPWGHREFFQSQLLLGPSQHGIPHVMTSFPLAGIPTGVRRTKTLEMALARVSDADIDAKGRFKYILIEVSDGTNKKCIVRGYKWAGFHGKCQISTVSAAWGLWAILAETKYRRSRI